MEPASTQTPEPTTVPTTDPAPAAAQEPTTQDPAATSSVADPAAQPPEPQQTTEPASTTAPESDPEPPSSEPDLPERVVPKPSEYELPEGMPDNVRIFAHENGFTQEQLNATVQQFGGYMQGMKQAEQESLKDMGQAHMKNWGPDAKHKLSLAKAAVKQNDPDGKMLALLNQSGYGNHPDVLNFLYSIGRSMQEGGFMRSTVKAKPGQKSAAQAIFGAKHPSSNG